ncbi:MAG TPA: hypothetical protein VFT45_10985 [Longimicrobium sp.]|nr:hypothetical protein [Longimicrobium sp.]
MRLLANRLLRRLSLIFACGAAFAPAAARAQGTVQPGTYVRVLAPSAADSLLAGTVIEIDSTSLLLAPPAAEGSRTVALRDIQRLEVRRQGARKTFVGALLGTIGGAAAGYTIAHAVARRSECEYVCGAAEAAASIALGAGGGVLGAIIGSRHRGPDTWTPAPVPQPAPRQ